MLIRALIAALLAATALGTTVQEPRDATVVVDLQQGQIEGVKKTIGDSRSYYSFKGIPYAEPPVGDLRLRDPVPGKPWTELRKSMEPQVCPQLNSTAFYQNKTEVIGEEDCLYLNIYTPAPVASGLPVMVYIHNGGYCTGSADQSGGTPERLLTKDVVLVSIQYRLGLLGFLSTGDSVLPGNLGLKDQTLALRWVNANIQKFGGDPKRITLFGQHTGAIFAQLHTLTPYSKGLFSRVIMQSGSALTKYAMHDRHAMLAANIGRDLDCPDYDHETPNSEELFKCLKEVSVEALVMAPRKYSVISILLTPMLMVPRVDGDYLPAHPIQLLREGRHQKVDVISGICQNEGGAGYFLFRNFRGNKTSLAEDFDIFTPALTGMYDEDNTQYLNRRVFYQFVNKLEFTDEYAQNFEQLLGEGIAHWQDEAAVLYEPGRNYGKNIYRYELQHLGERSIKNYFNVPAAKDWVIMTDDLYYLFDNVFGQPPVSRMDDVLVSEIIVSLWTNFAATGNPTPDLELGFKWRPMTSESDFSFLSLTSSPEMKKDHREKNREFWRNLPLKHNKMMYPKRFQSTAGTCDN